MSLAQDSSLLKLEGALWTKLVNLKRLEALALDEELRTQRHLMSRLKTTFSSHNQINGSILLRLNRINPPRLVKTLEMICTWTETWLPQCYRQEWKLWTIKLVPGEGSIWHRSKDICWSSCIPSTNSAHKNRFKGSLVMSFSLKPLKYSVWQTKKSRRNCSRESSTVLINLKKTQKMD